MRRFREQRVQRRHVEPKDVPALLSSWFVDLSTHLTAFLLTVTTCAEGVVSPNQEDFYVHRARTRHTFPAVRHGPRCTSVRFALALLGYFRVVFARSSFRETWVGDGVNEHNCFS